MFLISERSLVRIAIIILAFLVILHVWELNLLPLPWFDEVVFADIATHFGKTSRLTIAPKYDANIGFYGPFYFHLQSLIIKAFGLSISSFRMLNFLCGLFSMAILALILRKKTESNVATCFFILILSFDPTFNYNLHSGRMELVALFLCVSALYLILMHLENNKILFLAFAFFLISSGYLTTPRSLFILVAPVAIYFFGLYKRYRDDSMKGSVNRSPYLIEISIVFISFLLPLLPYIYYVGGVAAYIDLFTSQKTVLGFIGGSLLRGKYANHLIILTIVFAIWKWRLLMKDAIFFGIVVSFIAFSFFVKEVGPYSAMIIPLLYLMIIDMAYNSLQIKWFQTLVLSLLVINAAIFSIKQLYVFTSIEGRKISNYNQLGLDAIPNRTKILADFRFYYWAYDKNCTFETYEFFSCPEDEFLEYQKSRYKPDFIIMKPEDFSSGKLKKLIDVNYRVLFTINAARNNESTLYQIISKYFMRADYDCIVLKRNL